MISHIAPMETQKTKRNCYSCLAGYAQQQLIIISWHRDEHIVELYEQMTPAGVSRN